MRILHLCPLWYPISLDAPGGIETFLSRLLAHLVRLGCKNSLLATGDSSAPGELITVVESGLHARMATAAASEYVYFEQHQLSLALERGPEFDLIHSHIGPSAYSLSSSQGLRGRVLHTHHTPVGPDLEWYIERHPKLQLSTVSEFQARKLRRQGSSAYPVIPNGLDVDAFPFGGSPGDGLLFIGRMEHVKGPDLAIQVARSLGRPLILAGPIVEADFFDVAVRPYLGEAIRYVGVVDHATKVELFGRAGCVLLPFRGEEPFGLVTIEAMACGAPVVALANGALPEIVEPGVTGYLAREEAELRPMVLRAMDLDRAGVRARARARFDMAYVAEQYRSLYGRISAGHVGTGAPSLLPPP